MTLWGAACFEIDLQSAVRPLRAAVERPSGATGVFTIAEVKGLEFDNVLIYDITQGSDHLLKRNYHPKKADYLEEEQWNIQMELRHAFVTVTRARLLLMHLVPVDSNRYKELGGDHMISGLEKDGLL